MTPTATRTACEYQLWREGHERKCQQVVGLRSWYDSAGTQHTACPIHVSARLSVYPEADPPMPVFLHEDTNYTLESADPIDEWKRAQDWWAGATESERRAAWGDR